MNSAQFVRCGIRLYGRRHWKRHLARDIGVDPSTIHRIAKKDPEAQVPGPYEVALLAMEQNAIHTRKLMREAQKLTRHLRQRRGKLMPLKPRKPRAPRKPKPDPILIPDTEPL